MRRHTVCSVIATEIVKAPEAPEFGEVALVRWASRLAGFHLQEQVAVSRYVCIMTRSASVHKLNKLSVLTGCADRCASGVCMASYQGGWILPRREFAFCDSAPATKRYAPKSGVCLHVSPGFSKESRDFVFSSSIHYLRQLGPKNKATPREEEDRRVRFREAARHPARRRRALDSGV